MEVTFQERIIVIEIGAKNGNGITRGDCESQNQLAACLIVLLGFVFSHDVLTLRLVA
jgi:hypothetical protein